MRVGRLASPPRSPTISTPDFTGRSWISSPEARFISHLTSRGIVIRPRKSELRRSARWLGEHARTVLCGWLMGIGHAGSTAPAGAAAAPKAERATLTRIRCRKRDVMERRMVSAGGLRDNARLFAARPEVLGRNPLWRRNGALRERGAQPALVQPLPGGRVALDRAAQEHVGLALLTLGG